MQFRVLLLDASGAERALSVEAADAGAARRVAAAGGASVLLVQPQRSASVAAPTTGARFELDLFCQELFAMLRAGITVREALQTLAAKEREQRSAGPVDALLRSVEEGLPLSAAMAMQPRQFSPLLTESMKAAERTSDYEPALSRFVRYRQAAAAMRSRLVSAALYPVILLAVSAAVLLFLVGFVVPRFAQVYDDLGDRLSPASRALLVLGQVMTAHPVAFAVGAALAALLAVAAWRAGGHRLARAGLMRAAPPLARMLETAELARLYRTLALLLAGGMPLVSSLDLAAGVLPPAAGERLRRARTAIAEGQAFADSLAAHGLTTRVAERFFRVGERSGRLAEMVDHAADFHEEEVARFADRVARVIGPLMMLVMGSLIGLVVVLMYMPIFQLTEVLQ